LTLTFDPLTSIGLLICDLHVMCVDTVFSRAVYLWINGGHRRTYRRHAMRNVAS